MILTRSSEYAIELVLYLLSCHSKGYAPLNKIASEIGLSFHYLSKIARTLIQVGILNSCRGPHGGVALAKKANEITLFDIVTAIEGDAVFEKCILRPHMCDDENPCPVHTEWLPINKGLHRLFLDSTLEAFNETKTAWDKNVNEVMSIV